MSIKGAAAMAGVVGTNGILVRFEDVHKVYQMGQTRVNALAGVSLTLPEGDFVAIMGPSGSGKSTMLNVLGCLDRPTAGRYLLKGRDVGGLNDDDLSELRLRELGFIFQSFNLIPQLTVLENIELPLYYLGWEAQASADRARELAALVGLEGRVDHRPMELSGGQQQRVAIARALIARPAVVFADEPTGNLDSKSGSGILELLRTSVDEFGQTVVIVTHDPKVAAYADRVIVLADGQVAADRRVSGEDDVIGLMRDL
jgi:putative ABC transport system ATP-binding protein